MLEREQYGPEQLPTFSSGEYDVDLTEKYLAESFERALKFGFRGEFGEKLLNSNGTLYKDYILEHVQGGYQYTIKRVSDPQYTQYAIAPSEQGEHQLEFDNDLFLRVQGIGTDYESIVFGVTASDAILVVRSIDELMISTSISDPKTMFEIANIINLLKPA